MFELRKRMDKMGDHTNTSSGKSQTLESEVPSKEKEKNANNKNGNGMILCAHGKAQVFAWIGRLKKKLLSIFSAKSF